MNRTYEAMFPLLGVAAIYLVLVMLLSLGGIFGRWEFSLTSALDKLTGRGTVKAKAEKGA